MSSYFKCNFNLLFIMILSLGLMFFKVSQLSGFTEGFSSSCHLISAWCRFESRFKLSWIELNWFECWPFKKALCVNVSEVSNLKWSMRAKPPGLNTNSTVQLIHHPSSIIHHPSIIIHPQPSARQNQKQQICQLAFPVFVGRKLVSLQTLFRAYSFGTFCFQQTTAEFWNQ